MNSTIQYRVFIGSSTNYRPLVNAIKKELGTHSYFIPEAWFDVCELHGVPVFTNVIEAIKKADIGLFLLLPEDKAIMDDAGEFHHIPRDNVLFELGVSIGSLGERNSLIVTQQRSSKVRMHFASDIEGITYLTYSPIDDLTDDDALSRAAREVVTKLEKAITTGHIASATKYDITNDYIPRKSMYTTCGIQYELLQPETEIDSNKMSVEHVFRLWADPRQKVGDWLPANNNRKQNHIHAVLHRENDVDFCRMHFVYVFGFPPNVSIRPNGFMGCAVDIAADKSPYLCFDVRTSDDTIAENDLSINVRLIDRYATQWMQVCQGFQGVFYEVNNTNDWRTIEINLKDPGWSVFGADGNHRYTAGAAPDFSVICALVFEMGVNEGNDRLKSGIAGHLDVKSIRVEYRETLITTPSCAAIRCS